jgi:hypothetical protein
VASTVTTVALTVTTVAPSVTTVDSSVTTVGSSVRVVRVVCGYSELTTNLTNLTNKGPENRRYCLVIGIVEPKSITVS